MTELSELFAIRKDLHEKALSAKTPEERMHYALLKHACESDILDIADNSDALNRHVTCQDQTGELRSPHLLLGDCAEQMRDLAPNSIDAIVTDPPYGLAFMGEKWDNFGGKSCGNDSAKVRRQKAQEYAAKNSGAPRYANGHGGAPTLDVMRSFQFRHAPIFAEALRIAKPGAHLLAFGGTRTYHRLVCAIEDAGWEIRDCIMWVYGSGFPKSMDVAKAIDKMHENEGKKVSVRAASAAAQPWQGWGTCLKPAVEPIVVARKPLDGTVAANVLKYGTGAINIDACRVPVSDEEEPPSTHGDKGATYKPGAIYSGHWKHQEPTQSASQLLGRFPANLIHDGSDEVLALFPDSKGQCGSVKGTEPSEITNGIYGKYNARLVAEPRNDFGSAARFFYCAKASRAERGTFNDHVTVKPLALMRYLVRLVTRKGGTVLDPFMGSGTTGVAAIEEGMNFVGIERDQHYMEIATRRISAAKPEPPTPTQQELPL